MEKKEVFYGWRIVFIAFLIVVIGNVPVYNLISFYQVPIITEFGTTHFAFSIAQTLSSILSMIFSMTMSKRIAQGSIRKYMMIFGCVSAAFYIALSCAKAMWQVWILFPIGTFFGLFMALVPMNIMITMWFGEKKALATSLMMTGNGIGGVIWSPVFSGIIANYGWRTSYRVMAACVIFSALVLAPMLKKPEEAGREPLKIERETGNEKAAVWQGVTRAQALKTIGMYTYVLACVCSGIIAATILGQLPAYLIDCGFDYSPVMSTYSFVSIFGMVVMGFLIDKAGMKLSTCVGGGMIICELICFLLVPNGVRFAFIGACFMGIGHAIANLTPTQLATRVFGSKDYSGIFGTGYMGFTCGSVVGTPMAAGIRTATSSYQMAWFVILGVAAALIGLSLFSQFYSERLRKLYPNQVKDTARLSAQLSSSWMQLRKKV